MDLSAGEFGVALQDTPTQIACHGCSCGERQSANPLGRCRLEVLTDRAVVGGREDQFGVECSALNIGHTLHLPAADVQLQDGQVVVVTGAVGCQVEPAQRSRGAIGASAQQRGPVCGVGPACRPTVRSDGDPVVAADEVGFRRGIQVLHHQVIELASLDRLGAAEVNIGKHRGTAAGDLLTRNIPGRCQRLCRQVRQMLSAAVIGHQA